MSEYKVVSNSSTSYNYHEILIDTVRVVNQYLSKGWKVVDGLSVLFAQNTYYFYQTLIREIE